MLSAPLLSPSELAALQTTVLRRHSVQRAADTPAGSGMRPSPRRGHGMELLESRPYRIGDDPRHLDWRATARHGRPITKVFRAERHRSNFIVFDRSPTMAFGTRRQLKATLAARCAVILTFSALADHEPVGGVVLCATTDVHAGGRSIHAVQPFIAGVSAPIPTTPHRAAALDARLWRTLAHATRPGAHIYLISDFLHFDQEGVRDLEQLAAERNVTALVISDPAEQELTDVGLLYVTSPISGARGLIDTTNAQLRARFSEHRAHQSAHLRRALMQANVASHTLSTADDAFEQLQALSL